MATTQQMRAGEAELARVLRLADRVAAEAELEAGLYEDQGEQMLGRFWNWVTGRRSAPASQPPDRVIVSPSDPDPSQRQTPVPPSQLTDAERRLLQVLNTLATSMDSGNTSVLVQFQNAYLRASQMALPISPRVHDVARQHGIR